MPYIGKEPARVPVTAADIPDDSITAAKIVDGAITIADIADDAVTADKLANSINTAIAANTAKVTNATHTGDVTGATALTIAVDAVDIAMLSATGTASSTTFLRGDNTWVVPTDTNTVYTHPNHSGEVTSTADGAQVVVDNIIDEANLKISNNPTNGYVLTAQSGNTGGMTWAEMTGGGPSLGTDSIIRTNAQTISENITIGSTTNGMSAGPITIADSYTVTVNGNWSVV